MKNIMSMQRLIVATNITQVLIPYYQQNRAVVGMPDGGLSNPMPLLFDPTLGQKPVDSNLGQFSYPILGNVTRPSNDTDIAYMTVSSGCSSSVSCTVLD